MLEDHKCHETKKKENRVGRIQSVIEEGMEVVILHKGV